jgi:prolyl-tRNA synthetase
VDERAATIHNFSSGSNRQDWHWIDLNWGRDVALPERADLRTVRPGEGCPNCDGSLQITRGIEVGHIFQLGTKYSESMNATVLDENGNDVPMIMGCYGIGVSRVVAAAIEQNHDERGIIWPVPLAPFQVAIVSINAHRSEAVHSESERLHEALGAAGLEPLWDDREARPGVKFADMELIGVPHRIVVSDRGLAAGTVEYRGRTESASRDLPRENVVEFLRGLQQES